jgi:hypothetical protein
VVREPAPIWIRSNEAMVDKSVNIEEMARIISSIREDANKLKAVSGGIQAVDRNVDRILASVKMLEININDLVEILQDDK